MIIEKLRVKNYKSLEDVEILLRPLTVFVGPNNSGKSNILDCLELVKELAFLGPPAVSRRGGFRDLVWGGDLKREIAIHLEGRIGDGGGQQRFEYEIGLSGGEIAHAIAREVFTLHRGSLRIKVLERSGERQWTTWSEEAPGQETGKWGSSEERLAINQLRGDRRHPALGSFAAHVANWGFYRLAPAGMGSSGPARKETHLSEAGENLPSVLISIQSEDRRTFSELESYLKVAVPEIEEFTLGLTEDNRAYFRWREGGLPTDFNVKSWMSSDGTRQILGLLALRFGLRVPPLVGTEEPENFIHPGLLELVAGLLRSISARTQMLVSTHSPYLLNYLSYKDVVVIEKKGGKTQVKGLNGKKGIKEAQKVLGLGQLWYSGHIGGVP